jgi:PAS domain-containing protein
LRRSSATAGQSGTVWAISHDPAQLFEHEDQRFLQSVSRFAAAAYRSVQTTRERQQVQDRLSLTLSNAEIIGLWDWHIPEDQVFADERFCYLFGVDPARAAAGAPIGDFLSGIHPDDRGRVSDEIAAAMRTGEAFSSEYRLGALGGEITYVVARGRCERSEDGTPLRFPGVIVDVTDQRRAERALSASERQFQRLAQAMPNHVWTATPEGQLDWLNRQISDYSGVEGKTACPFHEDRTLATD